MPFSSLFYPTDEQEPAVSSDSDISLIMAMEVGLSDVELSTDQDCEEVKSWNTNRDLTLNYGVGQREGLNQLSRIWTSHAHASRALSPLHTPFWDGHEKQ